jgi:hypothetical protein
MKKNNILNEFLEYASKITCLSARADWDGLLDATVVGSLISTSGIELVFGTAR